MIELQALRNNVVSLDYIPFPFCSLYLLPDVVSGGRIGLLGPGVGVKLAGSLTIGGGFNRALCASAAVSVLTHLFVLSSHTI